LGSSFAREKRRSSQIAQSIDVLAGGKRAEGVKQRVINSNMLLEVGRRPRSRQMDGYQSLESAGSQKKKGDKSPNRGMKMYKSIEEIPIRSVDQSQVIIKSKEQGFVTRQYP